MAYPSGAAARDDEGSARAALRSALLDPLTLAALVLIGTALVVGGVNRSGHHLVIQLAALPALFLLLRHPAPLPLMAKFAIGAAGLAALQLVPLPPALWSALPGRELAVAILDAAGAGTPWRPLSLDPGATAMGISLLLAPLVAYLAVARLPWPTVRRILGLIALFAVLTALLGVAQRVTGGLSLYGGGHSGYATGLMINRNHQADVIIAGILLLPMLIPLNRRRETAMAFSVVLVLLFCTVAATTSRAGLLLSLPALALALAVTWQMAGKRLLQGAAIFALIAALLLTLPQFQDVVARFTPSGIDDRVTIGDSAWVAMRAFWPWGSGYGTFVPVYAIYEDLDRIHALYVTAAHNDYLQLLLEGGLPALAILLAAVLLVAQRGWALRKVAQHGEQWLPYGFVAVILVHSWTDYPLRMGAIAVLFGACLGATESLQRNIANRGAVT